MYAVRVHCVQYRPGSDLVGVGRIFGTFVQYLQLHTSTVYTLEIHNSYNCLKLVLSSACCVVYITMNT